MTIHPAASDMAYQFETYQVCPDSLQLERDFLCMLTSMETQSDHPIGVEIVQVAQRNNILPVSVSGFQSFPEQGIGGLMTLPNEQHPRAVLVGNRDFLIASGLQMPELLESTFRKWDAEWNRAVILGGWDGWVRGLVKFRLLPAHAAV